MPHPCPNSACALLFPSLDICLDHLNDSSFQCGILFRSLADFGMDFDDHENESSEDDEDGKYDGMKSYSI